MRSSRDKIPFMWGTLLCASTLMSISANGECINACSGHGYCAERDMCVCDRNFMGADCSERICPFGMAYVDTPLGDLDSSGAVDPTTVTVGVMSELYPMGVTEEYPYMVNSAMVKLDNTAHAYRECSNSGTCNRKTGECECLEGYWGSTCQRMHCPGFPDFECSGHGECLTVEKITMNDYGTTYFMWDKTILYGCLCDAGYYGGMCEERHCKRGVDPKYMDDVQTLKFPVYNLGIFTTSPEPDWSDGYAQPHQAYLKIKVYDQFGQQWLTDRLKPRFSCAELVTALEDIPLNTFPKGGIVCTETEITYGNPTATDAADILQFTYDYNSRYIFSSGSPKAESFRYKPAFWDAGFANSYDTDMVGNITGNIYHLEFFKNPGTMLPLEVETMLHPDGTSAMVTKGKSIYASWTDGQQGENIDYFANHCKDVGVNVANSGGVYYLTGFTAAEKLLLKACLGDSDGNPDNNIDVSNWDHGSLEYPHFIRLLRTSTDLHDGGYYVMLIYDTTITLDNLGTDGTFRLLQPFTGDYVLDSDMTNWEVYTTHGVLAMTNANTQANFDFASNMLFTSNTTYSGHDQWHGDMSCDPTHASDTTSNDQNKATYVPTCLMKGDIIVLLDPYEVSYNPQYLNMYTLKRLYTAPIYEAFGNTPWERFFAHPTLGTGDLSANALQRGQFAAYSTTSTNNADVTNPNTVLEVVEICHGETFTADGCYDTTGEVGTQVLGLYLTAGMVAQPVTTTSCGTQNMISFKKGTAGCESFTVALGCSANTACGGTITYTDTRVTGKAGVMYASDGYRANVIVTDITTNWATTVNGPATTRLYKFTPSAKSSYEYVSECANRGICNTFDGICDCFNGYTGEACVEIDAMAV